MARAPRRVLIVDGEPRVCRMIEDVLAARHFRCCSVRSARHAKRRLLTGRYHVAVLDMAMPDGGGMELLAFISDHGLATRAICTSGVASRGSGREARQAGACAFLERPLELSLLAEAVCRAADAPAGGDSASPSSAGAGTGPQPGLPEDFHAYHAALAAGEILPPSGRFEEIILEFAGALVQAVEAKDPHTRRHSEHVAFYAEHLSHRLGLAPGDRRTIRIAALLHDIGKMAVPDSVLTKPGRLSRREFAFVRQHPEVGAGILGNISLMQVEARLVRSHHENWDGSGYPAGLQAGQIPLGARILNLADSIDAMLMHRTYKRGYPVGQMLEELDRCAGTQFDPELVPVAVDFCTQCAGSLVLPEPAPQAEPA